MEYKRYLDLYKEHSIEEFYNWLSDGRPMEIRFLNDKDGNKFNAWQQIRELADVLNCFCRYNSLYITEYESLYALLRTSWTRQYNTFIGMNPRRKVPIKSAKGHIWQSYYGGLAGVDGIRNVFCDIEHINRGKGNATEAQIEECIEGARFLVKVLELGDYYINVSGNGAHLIYKVDNGGIDLIIPPLLENHDKVKFDNKHPDFYPLVKAYNRYIEKINKILQKFNPNLIVDEGAKDFSRIGRIPGAWNLKVGQTPRRCGTVEKKGLINNNIKQNILAAKPLLTTKKKEVLKRQSLSAKHRYNHLNIRDSPLVQLLLSQKLPSTLSRNHYLEQSLARLIRDNGIALSDIQHLIGDIDQVQQKSIQIDPSYLEDDSIFNPEVINAYCYACGIDFVYDVMEDVPVISEEYMLLDSYLSINGLSLMTAKVFLIRQVNATSYFELKSLIRTLVDEGHCRADIIITLRLCLKNWDYIHKNRIAFKIINRTRKTLS